MLLVHRVQEGRKLEVVVHVQVVAAVQGGEGVVSGNFDTAESQVGGSQVGVVELELAAEGEDQA